MQHFANTLTISICDNMSWSIQPPPMSSTLKGVLAILATVVTVQKDTKTLMLLKPLNRSVRHLVVLRALHYRVVKKTKQNRLSPWPHPAAPPEGT